MTKKVTKSVPAPVPTMTANGHASLNPELKQAMRDAKAAGKSTSTIAREFNVDASTAWVVLNGPSKGTGRVNTSKHSPTYVQAMATAKVARDASIAAANAVYAEAEKAAALLDSAWLAEQKAAAEKATAEKQAVTARKQEYKNRLATLKAEFAALKVS